LLSNGWVKTFQQERSTRNNIGGIVSYAVIVVWRQSMPSALSVSFDNDPTTIFHCKTASDTHLQEVQHHHDANDPGRHVVVAAAAKFLGYEVSLSGCNELYRRHTS
jgi:hypothetical protein